MARRSPDGEWVYPPLQEVLQEDGLYSMQEYIRRRQRTVEQYIAVLPIHTLCREATPHTGSSKFLRWWDQDHSATPEMIVVDAATALLSSDNGDGVE
jgi:hypothetical protein